MERQAGLTAAAFTLHEVADILGVHYMTAYRYVRLGLLEAHKVDGSWRVDRDALERFRAERAVASQPVDDARRRRVRWDERLESRLVAGDQPGAWGVIESALTAGCELEAIYLEVLTPAMERIGERWSRGELDIFVEHRASGIAGRLIGRLGHRFGTRGRSRGGLIVAAPAGEQHALPVSMLADLLRMRGWEVSDLGADVPSSSLVRAVEESPDVVAVGLSASAVENLPALHAACADVVGCGVNVVVGGRAVADLSEAEHRAFGDVAIALSGEQFHRLLVT